LVRRAGSVVSQRELMSLVWRELVVEESNLRSHLMRLRKAIADGEAGARYVINVPGRGYSFVAPVRRTTDLSALPPDGEQPADALPMHQLPPRLARMVGRDETVDLLSKLVHAHRFVSIVGPGGMGKTTVAVAAAHALLDDFRGAVFFVDLASLTDPALVPDAVAATVRFRSHGQDPLPGLIAFLAARRLLLVLDNCEHVVEAVASLAERVCRDAPQAHLLTTSRESLRVEGEHVHLLRPLDLPPEGVELTAARAMASPAVQLFIERAAASGHVEELNDADAVVVVDICRRMDGIALAIELAASRVGSYGIRGTAGVLEYRFRLLWQGRRSALPRHHTLQAMLDWSFNLLSERDRRVLRRLSVFVGPFTHDAALDVARDETCPDQDVADAITSLSDRSLLSVSIADGVMCHRLLHTTRAYAATKLAESDDSKLVADRHALHWCEQLKCHAIDTPIADAPALSRSLRHLGDIRVALAWTLSDSGDPRVGVEIAARTSAIFLGASLLRECQRWCELALAAMPQGARGTPTELALQSALAMSAMFTRGNGGDVREAIERGLQLAETLGDRHHRLHLLAGLHIFLTRIGDFKAAILVAEQAATLTGDTDDPGVVAMTDWMLGCAHHLAGDQRAALEHCEQGFQRVLASGSVHVDFFGYDHRVRALVALARASWIQGFPDRAARLARQALDEAQEREHPVNLCIAMIYSVTVLLWNRDIQEANLHIGRLLTHANRYSLAPYHAVGIALKGELAILRGEHASGVLLLRQALAALKTEQHHVLTTSFSRALAEGLLRCGDVDLATRTIDAALAHVRVRGETLDLGDLLRVRADALLAASPQGGEEAEALLLESIAVARRSGALSFELRAMLSLVPVWRRGGRGDEAIDMLAALVGRFSEGHTSGDLKAARELLDQHAGLRG
jgi:predicted ATPase/DNA-binding winged helix-turn-helix (wHTH) protein